VLEMIIPEIDPALQAILSRIRRNIENRSIQCGASSTVLNISTENVCSLCDNTEFVFGPNSLTVKPCVCREQKTIDRLLTTSGLTKYQRQTKLTDFKPSGKTILFFNEIKRYVNEYRTIHDSDAINKGLSIIGGVGIGKTMLLTGIANAFIDMGIPVVFVATPDLIAELRTSQFADNGVDMDYKINKLSSVPVCVFDDIAKEKSSEWVQTQYYRILDMRYRLRLTTLFSTNFTFDEIAERLGDAVSSRLYALTRERQFYLEANDYRVCGHS